MATPGGRPGAAAWPPPQDSLRERLARAAFSTVLRLAAPVYLIRLLLRGRAEPLYRAHPAQRFGFGPAIAPGALWVHAVSLGETRAAAPLIERLRQARPGLRLLLTHTTATGREAGQALLRDGDVQRWLPVDTPGAVRRFLHRTRPAVGVLMETEIWPNLQHQALRAGVPMVLANARLSARSLRRGEKFQALLAPAARSLRLALAQTADDADRLRRAGVAEVQVSGNLKFDLQPDEALLARGRAWRSALGRPVVMLAVSREGEEAAMLSAWTAAAAARTAAGEPLLLIVPRHPQRFDAIAALVADAGLSLARRSSFGPQADDVPPATAAAADVWLGDSMREMSLYYGLADVALLGGSFEKLGGQNLIEAAACGVPLIMGPHTFNFAEAAALSIEAGAARRVEDLPQALDAALALLAGPSDRLAMAEAAQRFAGAHRGAADRMAVRILGLIADPGLAG
ncbi:3-deoxy-D-manno-octulosonic acid transferase [Roseateles amylovorans]|uniref:3-deoxy-D-manno-octulosonic acid transferase n=1 Tax=Roseateles amylovorans TaxID=2978473 RepID=A0ABY6B9N7_9BURK|nr:3-deoxy-D-manno-octulosonic acid transferase [Roseateles amylovorans]UXH80285.1 3-deoxy-D-manno-octulosonic acid transferase [Roseateles amylovorans]